MSTLLYLLRHAATEANLARPPRLQGRRHNPPLAPLGIRQAEVTRDFLAVRPIDHCYASPMRRAVETATIIAEPHGIRPKLLEELTECDVGDWEGLDWQTIRTRDLEYYRQFMANPAVNGYPGGESFTDVSQRASTILEELLQLHVGQAILVVAHHVVGRTYLAGLLGLPLERARLVTLDNCGISIVVREGESTVVTTLNAAFHVQGLAA
jgi:broad specificity phosphatase PhoE